MNDMTKRQIAAIERGLGILAQPGQVVEVRILNIDGRRNRVDSGYFDDFAALARAIPAYNGRAEGVYITLNPVNPDLLARAANRVKPWSNLTTADGDIVRRRWLPIDIDPVRPSGISSSKAEHAAAHTRAQGIREWLSDLGWPQPLYADSGNGAHLLYPIDLPNENESTLLVQRCLQALAVKHSDAAVKIDGGNYNAARIWKLYFTLTAKGDSTATRPHRWSRIIAAGERDAVVALEQLAALAELATRELVEEPVAGSTSHFDVDSWLQAHGVQAKRSPWNGGWRWKLDDCPFSDAHSDGAYVVQLANGSISAGCHHNSCQGKGWRELRALVEDREHASTPSAPPLGFEQLLQAELQTVMDNLAEELKHEIRVQFDSLSA